MSITGAKEAEGREVVIVGVPVRTGEFVQTHTTNIVKGGGCEEMTRLLARMPDKKHPATLATPITMAVKTGFLETGVYSCLSRLPSRKVGNSAQWMLEKVIELPTATEENSFF